MSNFFDSEIIQNELKAIDNLQSEILRDSSFYYSMTREDKLFYIQKLSDLLEKQKIMYTRFSLSDDHTAAKLKETLKETIANIGYSSNMDIHTVFNIIGKKIENMKNSVKA